MACATSDQRTSNNVPLPALCEIVVRPKLVCSSIPAVLSSIEICVGKIKTVSNFCNNSDRSTAFTESFLQVYIYMWILITASACSFWRKFWSSGIATNCVTLDFSLLPHSEIYGAHFVVVRYSMQPQDGMLKTNRGLFLMLLTSYLSRKSG